MTNIASATTDPSNNTAHDPTNHPGAAIVHPAAHSTRLSLALARADIHTAINAVDDHRRRQYALAARDYAAEVLCDPTSTPSEMQYAGYYFADAEAIIAPTSADPDA
ncbi:hypothetical protein BTO20_36770 (plasmid) [Mycobacterium dioxanotrophicus]|uniref:Uncharacterized protein n=1 Tax=Mycobacterium dioxanotrophicus TaxID=482462 RepID=A0A1Y0CGD1_9MYCO|nr:hypothetical protein [Mycobacterium dioxanotrophicus]ART74212.1 hypothetical protein BTO20_36770 [Mycobacterium dioxanotrophicus]